LVCIESKREKIEEHLEQIEKRLGELEAEKKQLDVSFYVVFCQKKSYRTSTIQEYQKLDRDRRCLENAIYNRELESINSTIREV